MLIFNFGLTLVCLWIAFYVYNYAIRETKFNNNRFKIFALRDRLALLAMEGKISDNSKDYEILMSILNSSIYAMDKFNISIFLKRIKAIYSNPQMQKELESIGKSFETQCLEFRAIAHEYFLIMQTILMKETWLFRKTAPYLITLCEFLVNIYSGVEFFCKVLRKRTIIISNLNDELKSFARASA